MVLLKTDCRPNFFTKWLKRTPVAWLQLMREKNRLLVAIAGITFADFLMFMQLGFQDALYDSCRTPYQALDTDIVLASSDYKTIARTESTFRSRLYQAQGIPGVKSVTPVYLDVAKWRNPLTREARTILVFGVNPDHAPFLDPEIKANLHKVRPLNALLFDRASRSEFGPIPQMFSQQRTVQTELGVRLVTVTGLFSLGASFAFDGNVIVSDTTFHNIFPNRHPDRMDLGLIRLQPGADVKKVQAQLRQFLPPEVLVLTKAEMAEVEVRYWAESTPIGFIFGLGVGIGFVVGVAIVYQILYSDVVDHLSEYATLKAMGYSNLSLLSILFQEALLLAVLGYIPSLFISIGFYQLTRIATFLPMGMSLAKASLVFGLTVLMCLSSAAISSQKLLAADPADIF
ncbi:MAG: ABC transporter permease DevC [Pseudanabaenaceae cyanobacterium SKYGB_i_bin29]|nr:ABC transporter permease DevC [Pseudanabaenaceae cyanobacterium SKYG29]MDW8422163.1 ABC transporter permease DevC [Pseudanabaenaceae cyanobacterium SKYGB_i_bin29]